MAERVWERFLTEQDKAHVAAKGPRPVGFGEKPALLLVDLYRAVFGDKPEPILEAIKTWSSSCGLAGWNAIPHIQKLLSAAREAGIPIIHTTGLDKTGIEGWSTYRGKQPSKLTGEALERQSRMYDIIDEVKPLPGEAVIKKSSPSAFWGTPLIGHLNYHDIDTVITCGESTSGCVRASVVEGCTYRFRMVVVEECCFDRHEACHAMDLFDMNQKYSDVLPLADVLKYLNTFKAKKSQAA